MQRALSVMVSQPVIYGAKVDCLYFEPEDEKLLSVEDLTRKLEELKLDDKYKVTKEPIELLPKCPMTIQGEDSELTQVLP